MATESRPAGTDLADLTAREARARLERGEMTAAELAAACLSRIRAREEAIGAWAFLDSDMVMAAAADADARRGAGRPLGSLHGLPVAVKDIIDTADMPTENGTPLDAGRRPRRDAFLVSRLRAAGAVIMGKTVTTELAFFHPGKTRNPHDPTRTPGGSSSGSAAAVASGMVPLAVGTQTNGSMIRPASFCGVVGFKPTHGLIGRTGVLRHNAALDTIGTYARTIEDAALLADALAGYDPGDADTRPSAPPRILEIALSDPPVTPALAFVKTPAWDKAEPDTKERFARLAAELGKACQEVALPETFAEGFAAQRRLMYVGFAKNLAGYYQRGKEALSDVMRAAIEEGMAATAVDYLKALDWRETLNSELEPLFDRYDAIITPAAPGEAPASLQTTGDPSFCTLWSLCGVPAISLPLLQGPNGLPVGVQLVGRRGDDGRLLRTARWLSARLTG